MFLVFIVKLWLTRYERRGAYMDFSLKMFMAIAERMENQKNLDQFIFQCGEEQKQYYH